ncbi:protein MULTIPOLAR SPINDLE 1 isoform X4 [Cryptomeria japonica]|uniref:protein MULTIPOLAR SPINDLE 1 isoform X4 n=1 Tax=Cryptomeria japonica TaxID=3369 RepID=UPI0025ABE399|nr:protein MULTIPOLAR SPINDLE 1 isoform X4 [Cryptomeria japonica]
MDAQLKLAMAMSILRSRSKQPQAVQDLQHWKKKAKERKGELIKLKNDIKEIKDGMLSEMLPQVASCKCQFFDILNSSSTEEQIRSQEGDDCAMHDVLLRQFLRKVRLRERLKNHKDICTGCVLPIDHYSCDGEKGNLVFVANFLLELVNMQSPAFNKQLFSTYAHQAVDFIRDFDASVYNTEFHVQHIMRKLGVVPFIGQRILLATSETIISVTDSLFCMDPFDPTFFQVHESMFTMMQLVEHLVSDYACSWTADTTFNDRLLEEWIKCYLQVTKIGQMLEPRNSLYATYIDRIRGELAKQLNKIASSKDYNNEKDKFLDIWSSVFA